MYHTHMFIVHKCTDKNRYNTKYVNSKCKIISRLISFALSTKYVPRQQLRKFMGLEYFYLHILTFL